MTQDRVQPSREDSERHDAISDRFMPNLNRLLERTEKVQAQPDLQSKQEPVRNEARTKEAYSPSVSALAFLALKRDTGVDLTSADRWDAKTAEQRWWVKAKEEAGKHLDSLPPGVEVRAKASVGTPEPVNKEMGTQLENSGRPDSLYFAGSLNVNASWNARAKFMPVKDQNGATVKDESGSEKYFDSVYKDGRVFKVDGQNVLEIHNKDGLRTFLIPDPGKLNGGMDVSNYAQSMIDRSLRVEGVAGKVEFPMYDKTVKQDLTGIIGLSVKNSNLYLAQAKMEGVFQANKDGQRSFEKQSFEIRSRGLSINVDEPAATRMDKPFIVAQVDQEGRVFMSAAMNVADFKKPVIEKR
jgi:hypothetical protein